MLGGPWTFTASVRALADPPCPVGSAQEEPSCLGVGSKRQPSEDLSTESARALADPPCPVGSARTRAILSRHRLQTSAEEDLSAESAVGGTLRGSALRRYLSLASAPPSDLHPVRDRSEDLTIITVTSSEPFYFLRPPPALSNARH